jgi:HEPN domain-containing protein
MYMRGTVTARVMDLLKQAQSAMKEGNYRKAVEMAEQADTKLKTL